jgi:hypothetical protein
MPKLRRVSGQEAVRALERLGFVSAATRQSCCTQEAGIGRRGGLRCTTAPRTRSRYIAWHSATDQGHAR